MRETIHQLAADPGVRQQLAIIRRDRSPARPAIAKNYLPAPGDPVVARAVEEIRKLPIETAADCAALPGGDFDPEATVPGLLARLRRVEVQLERLMRESAQRRRPRSLDEAPSQSSK